MKSDLVSFLLAIWSVLTISLIVAVVYLHEQETTYLAAAADMLNYANKCGYGDKK